MEVVPHHFAIDCCSTCIERPLHLPAASQSAHFMADVLSTRFASPLKTTFTAKTREIEHVQRAAAAARGDGGGSTQPKYYVATSFGRPESLDTLQLTWLNASYSLVSAQWAGGHACDGNHEQGDVPLMRIQTRLINSVVYARDFLPSRSARLSARWIRSVPVDCGRTNEPSEQIVVIEPRRQQFNLVSSEVWRHRELLRVLVERDIRVRYKQTVLGIAWAIIQPLLMMVVFSIFFGKFAKMPSDGIAYPVFVYAGLLPWIFFANSITNASLSLVGSAALVSRVYFPRILIPLSAVGATLLDFSIASSILLAMMTYYGIGWSWQILLAPALTSGVILSALGVGILVSALTVSYRDFRFVLPFLIQFWMFATPVAFPSSIVPEEWRWLLMLNPMTGLIEGFRAAFLDRPLDAAAISISLVFSITIFVVGVAYFDRVERRFADVI